MIWYFTCKHVSLFKIPPIIYVQFLFFQKLSTMNVLDPIFLIARCSTIFASDLPEGFPQMV